MYLKIIKSKYTWFGLLGVIIFFLLPKKEEQDGVSDIDTSESDLTDSQAKRLADLSETAMSGIGTKEQWIFNNLLPLSNESFNHVVQIFGIRKSETLPQWLMGDLFDYEYKRLADKFEIL